MPFYFHNPRTCMVVCFREHAPVAILAANSKRHFRAAWTVMKDCRCHFAWHCVYSLKRARPVGLSGVRRQVYYRSTLVLVPPLLVPPYWPAVVVTNKLWTTALSSRRVFSRFLSTPEAYMRGRLTPTDTSQCIHINLERKFRGTKWRPTAKRSETRLRMGGPGVLPRKFSKNLYCKWYNLRHF